MYFLTALSIIFFLIGAVSLLALIVFLIGLIFTDQFETEMVDYWCDGITFFFFTGLITFGLGLLFRAFSII